MIDLSWFVVTGRSVRLACDDVIVFFLLEPLGNIYIVWYIKEMIEKIAEFKLIIITLFWSTVAGLILYWLLNKFLDEDAVAIFDYAI